RLRIAAHQELVAAHLPALQPIEEGHAEQARAQLPGLGDERRDRALADAADRQSVERDRRGAGAAVRGLDIDGIVEDFEREAWGAVGVRTAALAPVSSTMGTCARLTCAATENPPPLARAISTVRPLVAARPGMSSASTRSLTSRSSKR